MTIKIAKRIVGYKVLEAVPEKPAVAEELERAIESMNENVSRPETLPGATYKLKTPLSEHALYVTINDIVLNPGTAHEQRRPYEIFINSKNMDHFQWVLALTRVVSAVFRKGGDCTFLVEELKAVFDPKGGYFKKGGRFMPSLVAEIGECIEKHLMDIGMIQAPEIPEHAKRIMDEKRVQFEARSLNAAPAPEERNPYPAGAQLCNKCMTKAMIMMDGCMTCLSCGDSKCG
ncbi:MAG: NrdJb [Gammaproteobacteria bacterium]|nr:NrdJb [Gammaproteobacteria bacterium]